MSYRIWPILIPFALITSACGGAAPLAPSSGASSSSSSSSGASGLSGLSAKSVDGTTVSAIDGQAMPLISVKIGDRAVTSDASGAFHMDNLADGSLPAVLTGSAVVDRHMTVSSPFAAPLRASLIPATFDLTAFDEMFRGTGQLQRWTTAPSLIVLTTVMQYESSFGDSVDFHATSERLTEAETTQLIDQLTEALSTLTGNTFTTFASVQLESPASGAKVNVLRAGQIVVGRYKGLQALGNTIGLGRWATDGHGQVTGGTVMLDRDFDKSSDMRRLLRTHELGHALGYLHVTSRTSIMNPAIGPEVTAFDRDGAAIAFQRNPGNISPDTDPTSESAPRSGGGLFGIVPGTLRTIWAAPTVCGPMGR